jgi:A/G-specific adenine glycosylase
VSEIEDLGQVRRALLRWHREHGLRAPWRESGDPYEVLLAAVMAQQTQMSRVMPMYERFLIAFPTVEALASASVADVIRAWAGMGYNQRALRLHRAARRIARDGWPREAADLAQIEGIGPFTAAIVASFAFGRPAACVDTNVRRVLGRLAGDERISATALQHLADAVLARSEPARWNQALMDYGARVCTPRPKCDACVVSRWCAWRRNEDARPLMVAEERPVYVGRAPKPTEPYTASRRYARGRLLDVLRSLPHGGTLSLDGLAARMSDGGAGAPAHDVGELVDGLVRDGLAAWHDRDGVREVSLPGG